MQRIYQHKAVSTECQAEALRTALDAAHLSAHEARAVHSDMRSVWTQQCGQLQVLLALSPVVHTVLVFPAHPVLYRAAPESSHIECQISTSQDVRRQRIWSESNPDTILTMNAGAQADA